jgi:hypothetical protein
MVRLDVKKQIVPFRETSGFDGWELPDGRRTKNLTDEEAKLPILKGLPAWSILERIRSGWRPENERVDTVAKLLSGALNSTFHFTKMEVYVEFPDSQKMKQSRSVLRASGYRLRADGSRRLSVVIPGDHDDVASDSWRENQESRLDDLVRPYSGEVSGHELQ